MTVDFDDGLPIVERAVVRAVVVEAGGRVLLLETFDLAANATGAHLWELPGGGIEGHETVTAAVVREVREETGLRVRADQVEAPRWRRDASFRYRGTRRVQHEVVVVVRLDRRTPATSQVHRVGVEADDLLDVQWWWPDEIAASKARFYPVTLPISLPRLLRGEPIDEPTEFWP